MNTKIVLLGKRVSLTMLVGALVLAASGAAVGTALADLSGDMAVSVSQSLRVEHVSFPNSDTNWIDNSGTVRGIKRRTLTLRHSKPDQSLATVTEDRTAFQAAAGIYQGDKYLVQVCFGNASSQPVIAQLDLALSGGLEAEVFGGDEEGASLDDRVTGVTKVGASSWKFLVAPGADGTGVVTDSNSEATGTAWEDCIGITVISDITSPPGDYKITAKVRQSAY